MRTLPYIVFALLLSFAVRVEARDIYLVRFRSLNNWNICRPIIWRDRILLYNRTPDDATVRVIGISDGPGSGFPSLVVPPGRVVDFTQALGGGWTPGVGGPPLFVLHLDVPDGVTVNSSDEVLLGFDCGGEHSFPSVGHASMPVFDHLIPAGTPQVHLDTDLGARESRTNVIVHNAGSVPATAQIELKRECDDVTVDQRVVMVPANSTIQVTGLNGGDPQLCGGYRYTVVTVDQPSLSVASNVTLSVPATVTGLAPVIDLSVAHSHEF